jgi:DNA-binding NarL/FixJ family response regulator
MIDILLIEDNKIFRKTLTRLINSNKKMACGNQYGSAEDALKAIEQNGLAPDIVLLDIGLPGMNGVQCIPHLKNLCPEANIVMLTIHDDDDNIFRAVCSGAAGYLLKDSPPQEIIQSLELVLQGGAAMNAYIAKRVLDLFQKLAAPPGDYDLTRRELEILQLLVDSMSKKQIAARLYLSQHTVDSHIRNIYGKLEVHTRSGAVAKALKERLL